MRRRVGPVTLSRTVDTAGVVIGSDARYLFADAQGSMHRITDASGSPGLDSNQWFADFGRRADAGTGVVLSEDQIHHYPDTLTRHGYTGHEQMDGVALVHMNGRVYDPLAKRFLQADPLVADPMDLQALNR
ncbi:MAG: hypothetical protein WB784_00410, partial [Rhodanobacteraceae bacterium]